MAPVSVFPVVWVVIVVLLAVVLLVCLVAAMFSGRPGAVLAGVVGALLLGVGGVLLVGAAFFYVRHAPATPIYMEEVAKIQVRNETPRRQVAEAPDLSGIASDSSPPQDADKVVPGAEQVDAPSGPPRPAWMDDQQGLVGGVYRTTVKVGPWFSRTECEQQLPQALREAVKTYADHFLGEENRKAAAASEETNRYLSQHGHGTRSCTRMTNE